MRCVPSSNAGPHHTHHWRSQPSGAPLHPRPRRQRRAHVHVRASHDVREAARLTPQLPPVAIRGVTLALQRGLTGQRSTLACSRKRCSWRLVCGLEGRWVWRSLCASAMCVTTNSACTGCRHSCDGGHSISRPSRAINPFCKPCSGRGQTDNHATWHERRRQLHQPSQGAARQLSTYHLHLLCVLLMLLLQLQQPALRGLRASLSCAEGVWVQRVATRTHGCAPSTRCSVLQQHRQQHQQLPAPVVNNKQPTHLLLRAAAAAARRSGRRRARTLLDGGALPQQLRPGHAGLGVRCCALPAAGVLGLGAGGRRGRQAFLVGALDALAQRPHALTRLALRS